MFPSASPPVQSLDGLLVPMPAATSGSGRLEIGLNLNVEDGHNETPLSLALWTEQFSIAQQLIKSGADIECMDREEPGLLYVAIFRELPLAAMFLLENGADYKKR